MIKNIAGIFLVITATLIFVACGDEPNSQPPVKPAQPAAEIPATIEHDPDGNTEHADPTGDVDTTAISASAPPRVQPPWI